MSEEKIQYVATNARAYLRGMYGASHAEKVEEYIRECEHMEGLQYWSEFKTMVELGADFLLYVQNCEDKNS